jgi:uncharacterized protein (TIGR02996 family)
MYEQRLLSAILDDPDDDTLRLVYADCLEEQGDPRGEFIRIQCALARASNADPRRPAWQTRERELLTAHEPDWVGSLRGLFDEWEFRRGFIEQVTILPRLFLAGAEALFRLLPLRHVHFYQRAYITVPEMRELCRCPHLDRLRSLKLNTDRGLRDDGVGLIASCPYLTSLTELDLSDNWIRNAGAETLAAATGLPRLQMLHVQHNPIGRDGKHALRSRFGAQVQL